MGDKTHIQWTEATWNPLAAFDRESQKRGWFCTRVSPGCLNCYAAKINQRLGNGHDYRVPNLAKIEFRLIGMQKPLAWKEPRMIFVNSMTDLFHESVPDEMIDQVFAVMALAHWHTFQVLTKRAARMREYMNTPDRIGKIVDASAGLPAPFPDCVIDLQWPLANVWLGVSVENQEYADERIPELLQTPAAVRFLSCEPLLGPIDLGKQYYNWTDERDAPKGGIGWVIVGGESGPGARGFFIEWAATILLACYSAGVPAFLKQLGAKPRTCDVTFWHEATPLRKNENGDFVIRLKNSKGGDPVEWPAYLRVRDFPGVPA